MNMLHLQILPQTGDQIVHGGLETGLGELTLPDHHHMPSQAFQRSHIRGVTLLVAPDLLFPEVNIGTWLPVTGAPRVRMPEASVDEYN